MANSHKLVAAADAHAPAAHAASHQNGGTDEIDVTGLTGAGGGAVATDVIWDTAGDTVVGTGANTAAKLGIGAVGGALSRLNGTVQWNSGTSNPTGAAGDRYWRSDLGLEIYYDGTRWLTTTLYTQELSIAAVQPLAANNGGAMKSSLWNGVFNIWAEDFIALNYVATTNTGSAYWTIELLKETIEAVYAASSLASFTTAADAADRIEAHTVVIDALLGTGYGSLYVTATKTSTPGTLVVLAKITYRLVVA